MGILTIIILGLLFLLGITKIAYELENPFSSKNKKSKPVKPSFFEWEKNDALTFSFYDADITLWLDSFFGDEVVVFTTFKKQNKYTILNWDERLGCFTDGESELHFIENKSLTQRQRENRLKVVQENHKLLQESINEIKSIDNPSGNYINYEDTTRNSSN